MKILFIAPWVPSKVRPRSLGILREMCAEHDVWFIGGLSPHERVNEIKALNLAGSDLVTYSRYGAILRAGLALFTPQSLQVAYMNSPGFRKTVTRRLATFDPDVVHFNVIRSAAFAPLASGRTIMTDLDEIRSDYYRQLAERSRSLIWRLLGKLECQRLRRAERDICERSDVVFVSSPLDVPVLEHRRKVLLRSPYNGSTGDRMRQAEPHGAPPRSKTILFVGRMSYQANVEAILGFVREAFPAIRESVPGVNLKIVGENPPPEIRALMQEDIQVLGYVDNLAPYYREAGVSIVPISLGTGVQMKLIQSLAFGTATVATREATRRAGLVAGTQVRVADTSSEWVYEVRRVLNDPELAKSLTAEGNAWIDAEYYEQNLYAGFRGELKRIEEQIESRTAQ